MQFLLVFEKILTSIDVTGLQRGEIDSNRWVLIRSGRFVELTDITDRREAHRCQYSRGDCFQRWRSMHSNLRFVSLPKDLQQTAQATHLAPLGLREKHILHISQGNAICLGETRHSLAAVENVPAIKTVTLWFRHETMSFRTYRELFVCT